MLNFPTGRLLLGEDFYVLRGKAGTKLARHARPSIPWS